MRLISLTLVLGLLLLGCAGSQKVLVGQSAEEWERAIRAKMAEGDYVEAYSDFRSLESEHSQRGQNGSLLLEIADLYSENGDSENANKLYNRYVERYASDDTLSIVYYKKIRSYITSLGGDNRNQLLLLELLGEVENYEKRFPNSTLKKEVEDMKSKLKKKVDSMNEHIFDYYKRKGTPVTVEYYRNNIYESRVFPKGETGGRVAE